MKPVNLVELAHAVQTVEKKQAMARRLKEQEVQLAQARKMADLGIVAAGVAHEINNPNTFVRGNLQTLKRYWDAIETFIREAKAAGVESPAKLDMIAREMPGMFKALIEGTDRIKTIVEKTTAFTRLNSENNLNGVDLNHCVTQALEYQTVEGKESAVETHLETGLPQVGGARDELVEVIVELLKNSLKAVKDQENPCIEIRTYQATPERICLEIRDNGPGIEEKHKDRIFTPFFTTESRIGRPGLGLSKAFALVTGFGGEIRFNNEEGGGARFTVNLPVFNERICE
jgi:C4-dicarboxylate-specific signal transduction histidine kinase